MSSFLIMDSNSDRAIATCQGYLMLPWPKNKEKTVAFLLQVLAFSAWSSQFPHESNSMLVRKKGLYM